MAEDVLNSNMAGLAFSDYNGLSESVTAALKERDEMIYKQWIIINELERKLSQYYPLDEFYAGITRHFYHDNGSGEAKNASNHASCKLDASASDVIGRSSDEATPSDTRPQQQQLQQQQPQQLKQATEPSPLDRFDPDVSDNHHHHHHHHYENVELKIHEEDEEEKEAVNGNAANSTGTGFTDDPSGCYEVATANDDILVDETSTNFENLLEEYASSDVIGSNGDGDDSFNSSQSSSSSEDEEDDDDGGGSNPCVFGASNSSSNSGNSTLRKKQKNAVSKLAEVAVAAGSHESLGSVEEHLFGSVSQGGTLRRDHPSISKIFHPNSSTLSASSPSVFSSSFSPASLTSPGFSSSPSFVSCPCPDCLGNGSQQRHPLFSQTLHRSNQQQQQQQQQDYNPAGSKASSPIKPLAPLGLEPWRLKLRTLNNMRTYQDQGASDCQPGHPFAARHQSLDAMHNCNCKVQSYSNGNLSTGSNSSLDQQQCHHSADLRQRGPTSSWRKTPERMSSGSESLSSVGNLSSCSCSCESSQRCSRCSTGYQMLPGYPSPSPSSPRSNHTRFQFPPQGHLQELYQSPANQSIYHHHNHLYGTVPNHVLANQAQHHHQQHYNHHHNQQQHLGQIPHQHLRLGGVRTDFYHAPSTSHVRPGQGVTNQGQVSRNVSDRSRKRTYRIGLNIFNKKPARGIEYLIENKFLEPQPNAVAKFLISRKGVSRKMIGQYMGNTQDRFSMEVLKCFSEELDLTGLQIDVALRVYQSQFEISGEAQRIEKFMEAFASRYRECNPHLMGKLFRTSDSMFVLSYAIMMLNTDLHNVNIKPEKKMTLHDFIKNLKGSDDGSDINCDYLSGIYERMKEQQFTPLSDHTTQVVMVDRMIQGKKESLVDTHRRFVCHFRMHEVHDVTRNERIGSHSRGLFLFNDLLIVTKLSSKKKKNSTHHLKHSVPLLGVAVYLLETPHYKFGIRLKASSGKVLVTLCANNNEERMKFVEDLRESILETEKMEEYLGRVKVRVPASVAAYQCKEAAETLNRYSKDSGVVDVDLQQPQQLQPHQLQQLQQQQQQQQLCKYSDDRRSSRTSVDSGMSSTGSANLTKDVATSVNNNNNGKLNRSLSQKGANLG